MTAGTAGPSGSGYKMLTVAGPSGATGFVTGTSITAGISGASSGTFYIAGNTLDPAVRTVVIADAFDDSDDLEMGGDSIFDFTETDPFSEGGY